MPRLATSAQLRAARGLLGWSRGELAEKIGVSLNAVNRMENKDNIRNHVTREKAQDMMEQNGIGFIDDDGTRGEGVFFSKSRKTLAN